MGFDRVTVIGVGLMGASFALAIKDNGLAGHITGTGRNEGNLKKAKAQGIIDSYETDLVASCKNSDLVALSTPVGTFHRLVKKIAPTLKKGAILIDVGSVKGSLVYDIEAMMPEGASYVACHPIAGSDKSGMDAASGKLFKGALCIIAKSEFTDPASFEKIKSLWEAVGSIVKVIPPDEHDLIYALVSHVPHLTAYALVNAVSDVNPELIGYAGQGFKDSTRIAKSSPDIWKDIFMLNKDNILKIIEIYKSNLDRLCDYIKSCDMAGLARELDKAKTLRESLKDNREKD